FDACIGYISITATLTKEWEKWWRNPEEVKLYQFIGKDNIPFHTVIFPSSLLGSGEKWTMLNHISSTEYLNYESGKFSKSKGIGVFGSDAMESGIPADVWRFYLFYNRPEKSDALFTWKDFQEKVNSELIGNLANLVNRTLSFVVRYFDGKLPQAAGGDNGRSTEGSELFRQQVKRLESEITEAFDRVRLREAFRKIFKLSALGNKRFQEEEPWKRVKEDPGSLTALLNDLVYLVRDLAILVHPFIPETSQRIVSFFGFQGLGASHGLGWTKLGSRAGIEEISRPELLFKRLENKEIEAFRERFSGSQADRKAQEAAKQHQGPGAAERLTSQVDLRVGRILEVENHPKADKLATARILLAYYGSQGRFAKGNEILTKLLSITEDKVAVWVLYGQFAVLYDAVQAKGAFEKAIVEDPQDQRGYQAMASFYSGQKQWAEAAETARKYLKLNPDDKDMQNSLTRFLVEAKQYDEANRLMEAALAENPNDIDTLVLKGVLAGRQG
ncbi:hypothetical protein LCGC14_2494840, partial [marine sediment metagenome]